MKWRRFILIIGLNTIYDQAGEPGFIVKGGAVRGLLGWR